MNLPDLTNFLKSKGLLNKLQEPDIEKIVRNQQKEFYQDSLGYSFDISAVTFSDENTKALIGALEGNLVDTCFVKAYPTSFEKDVTVLEFLVRRLADCGVGFYELDRVMANINACKFSMTSAPLWQTREILNDINDSNWRAAIKELHISLPSQPTLSQQAEIQPQLVFTSSVIDLPQNNPLLVKETNGYGIKEFDSFSEIWSEKLTFVNLMAQRAYIMRPDEWLIFASLPHMRKGKTSKLTFETWELTEAISDKYVVGGNSNIEGLYLGFHGPANALSYARARTAIR